MPRKKYPVSTGDVFFNVCPEAFVREGSVILFFAEGPELVPEDDYYRHYRTQLNDYVEHFLEVLRLLQLQEFVYKYQVSCAAYGQPFCNSLDYSEDYGFYYLYHSYFLSSVDSCYYSIF